MLAVCVSPEYVQRSALSVVVVVLLADGVEEVIQHVIIDRVLGHTRHEEQPRRPRHDVVQPLRNHGDGLAAADAALENVDECVLLNRLLDEVQSLYTPVLKLH